MTLELRISAADKICRNIGGLSPTICRFLWLVVLNNFMCILDCVPTIHSRHTCAAYKTAQKDIGPHLLMRLHSNRTGEEYITEKVQINQN